MKFLRRLNYMLHQRRTEADLAEEIEVHLAMSKEAAGAPSTMGNITRAREDARAVWIWSSKRCRHLSPSMCQISIISALSALVASISSAS